MLARVTFVGLALPLHGSVISLSCTAARTLPSFYSPLFASNEGRTKSNNSLRTFSRNHNINQRPGELTSLLYSGFFVSTTLSALLSSSSSTLPSFSSLTQQMINISCCFNRFPSWLINQMNLLQLLL